MVLVVIAIRIDFHYKMREKFEQSLDVCRLELSSLHNYKRPKLTDDEVDEYIDITGDCPEEPESIDRYQPKDLSALDLVQQPPSKIYYDHIEKESSDGGFFDRDDLDDEDEKNDLVIDFKLNADTGEKKTDHGISHDRQIGKPSSLTGSEVVFNFTLVDTKLVYNEPTYVQKLQPHFNAPFTDFRAAPGTKPSTIEDKPSEQAMATSLKDVRLHSFWRRRNTLPSSVPDQSDYRTNVPAPSVPPPISQHSLINRPSIEPIGSRLRPSAFSPPMKSQSQSQSVPLLPTAGPISTTHFKSQYQPLVPVSPTARYPKAVGHEWSHTRAMNAPAVKPSSTFSCLPPQFGFGSSLLRNLHDSTKPLDFSKDSPLSQYESMLKYPPQEQQRYGHSILRSMPIPEPPKPPPTAIRPKLVAIRHHPTISRIHRPNRLRDILKTKPNPPTPKVVPQRPPPQPQAPAPPQPAQQAHSKSFRKIAEQVINAFFHRRRNEICSTLRLFTTEAIDMTELFRRLEHLQVRVSRDYLGIAWIMIQRHGYRFRTGVPPVKLDYRWTERPQEFAEYFMKVRNMLRPHAPEETLNIYRMVVDGLLEQFRDSIEHFLSRNLQR
ncbi:uncharacterized protein LOC129724116 isoform X2 [Wyeomyia smithii]|uniref:uncharacterized protein LOC129724116 isoform X2 n=1 Tax=Wyeomyia smithii TaxID=174621 RepID=UPI002467E5F2|nr:uncharacterized protein LOC129724116 isoform X2 [Wyeomyia smithii]XP_055534727.1 uncharacterized protein LOC129724116 isoform X2 [Wyeomyia smithii]XP_055534728.1 uncharacterized protein LOC129724116 isoform X2 [Wyeomyia smithii]